MLRTPTLASSWGKAPNTVNNTLCSVGGWSPCPGLGITWPTGLSAAAARHHESHVARIASPGKEQNPNCKVWFLPNVDRFCTIVKSKNHKSNHSESGTVCPVCIFHFTMDTGVSKLCQNKGLPVRRQRLEWSRGRDFPRRGTWVVFRSWAAFRGPPTLGHPHF